MPKFDILHSFSLAIDATGIYLYDIDNNVHCFRLYCFPFVTH